MSAGDPGPGKPDQRKAPRVARPFMVRFRNPLQDKWHAAPLKDLSRDGARLISEETFPPGTLLEVWIGMPVFHDPTRLMARVVWQKPAFTGRMQMSEQGLVFTNPDPKLRQALEDAVLGFLKKQAPPPRR